MAEWKNLYWNNNFVNQTKLPLLYENSGAILLVLLGLMAGSLAVQQADQIRIGGLKFSTDCTVRIFM